jgi:hypothetical protein
MLSLIIVVTIVVNVVLWSYQMNQFDLERMHEDVKITGVSSSNGSSPWFPTQSEFTVDAGSRVSGTYVDTQSIDGSYESFAESAASQGAQGSQFSRLEMGGNFTIDLLGYPPSHVQTVEIMIKYRASDSGENWYLNAYNWTSSSFSDSGFNSTSGDLPTTAWDDYAVNLTDQWNSYVNGNGTVNVRMFDLGTDANQTTIDVDFFALRVTAAVVNFTFENDGPYTSHLVSLWIDNSTLHQRYDISAYVNAGDTISYTRANISLPPKPCIIKVVTERGNIAVYSPN